jgi:protein gp37
MAETSKIEWTDATWNPIVGCSLVSPACTNCYAMAMAARIERMTPESHYAGTTRIMNGKPVWTGALKQAPDETLLKPLRWKKPRRIFVNSMSDLFHESVPDEWLDRIFAVMALAHWHTFQVLTKRPSRMRDYLKDRETPKRIADQITDISIDTHISEDMRPIIVAGPSHAPFVTLANWRLPNVWLGVTAEDQRHADERIFDLLSTPAAVRFVSCEPTLGAIRLDHLHAPNDRDIYNGLTGVSHDRKTGCIVAEGQKLDWVIAGGESGPDARPAHPDWFRSLRDQCAAAGVPFFFKQHGEWIGVPDLRNLPGGSGPGFGAYDHCQHDMQAESVRVGKRHAGRHLDGREHNEFPRARS